MKKHNPTDRQILRNNRSNGFNHFNHFNIYVMKLTGKCKEDFTDYLLKSNLTKYEYQGLAQGDLCESTFNTHIIEFFDSVNIFIQISYENQWFDSYVNEYWINTTSENRITATNKAIENANYLYNSRS